MATAAPGRSAGAPAAKPAFRDEPDIVAPNYALLVIGVMLASMIQVLDTTITIVAVPHMQSALGASSETVTWVLTSYIIAAAVSMPITGWLSGKVGARLLFLVSVAGFILASMLCGIAQSLEEMVLFRAFQGIAGAFISPLSQSFMLDATRPSKRGQIMALWGMGVVIGPVLGPILGGILTENWNWRWVFYVNLPLGIAAFVLLWMNLPRRAIPQRKFDLAGFLLIGTTLAALQLMLDRGHQQDWFESKEIWTYAVVSGSAAWMATIHLATTRQPLFDRGLFRDPNLLAAMFFIFIIGAVLFASMSLLPNLLQDILGYGVVETGALLAMRGIGVLISMQFASQLMRRGVDTRLCVSTGFVIAGYSLYMMSHWNLDIGKMDIALPGLVQGLGVGLVFIPLNTTAFATLAPQFRTDASSLMNLFRNIGSSLGVAVLTAILAQNIQTSHSDLGAHITANSIYFDFSGLDQYKDLSGAALGMVDGMVNRQAAMIAYVDDFHVMMLLTWFAAPLVFLMRKPPRLPGR
ncbi:MAG: multidrug efflux MFS transporter [Novosphingobium sp.]|nr:multidrug efflux MFS transporter [Novosphingobium sp.]MBO9603116.1 multidrug efflux MFS transporter [Novosphingobium sp.]